MLDINIISSFVIADIKKILFTGKFIKYAHFDSYNKTYLKSLSKCENKSESSFRRDFFTSIIIKFGKSRRPLINRINIHNIRKNGFLFIHRNSNTRIRYFFPCLENLIRQKIKLLLFRHGTSYCIILLWIFDRKYFRHFVILVWVRSMTLRSARIVLLRERIFFARS